MRSEISILFSFSHIQKQRFIERQSLIQKQRRIQKLKSIQKTKTKEHTKNKNKGAYKKQRSLEIINSLKTPENGGYLLSHKRSTIGAAELNDPVRNGKGWDLSTITTSI